MRVAAMQKSRKDKAKMHPDMYKNAKHHQAPLGIKQQITRQMSHPRKTQEIIFQ